MALSDLTSSTAVKRVVIECDRVGREEFLRRHGRGHAREHILKYKGKEYDSKAIAAVAHDIQNPELAVEGRHIRCLQKQTTKT